MDDINVPTGRGHENAVEDGINIVIANGYEYFELHCQRCGRTVLKHCYTRGKEVVCPYCKKEERAKKRKFESVIDERTANEKRFDDGVDELRKQLGKLDEKYRKAIAIAKTRLYDYGSIPEVMMAIALLANGFRILPQWKVGKYRVDFAVHPINVIVEVDGKPFHSDQYESEYRDAKINLILKGEWKIVHIPSSIVAKDVNRAVRIVKNSRKYKGE